MTLLSEAAARAASNPSGTCVVRYELLAEAVAALAARAARVAELEDGLLAISEGWGGQQVDTGRPHVTNLPSKPPHGPPNAIRASQGRPQAGEPS